MKTENEAEAAFAAATYDAGRETHDARASVSFSVRLRGFRIDSRGGGPLCRTHTGLICETRRAPACAASAADKTLPLGKGRRQG